MTYPEIKSLLVLKGIKSCDIAKAAGCSKAMVSHVISGQRQSGRIRKIIARRLGKPVNVLWPDGK